MEEFRTKIEDYGVTMETMGLSPVAARVFVYLLFSKQEQSTFEEIIGYFKVSKSAVSNALKMLSMVNMIESRTIGGQRKRYFAVNFERMLNQSEMTKRFRLYHNMLDDVRTSRGNDDPFSEEIGKVSGLYKMMEVEIPIILERWKKLSFP